MPQIHTIQIKAASFEPSEKSVREGDKVRFNNQAGTAKKVVSPNQLFGSDRSTVTIAQGGSSEELTVQVQGIDEVEHTIEAKPAEATGGPNPITGRIKVVTRF